MKDMSLEIMLFSAFLHTLVHKSAGSSQVHHVTSQDHCYLNGGGRECAREALADDC